MTQHVLHHHALTGAPASHRWSAARMVRFVTDRYLLLPAGALIALVWTNTAGESYFQFAHAIAFPVNEIGMALFLCALLDLAVRGLGV